MPDVPADSDRVKREACTCRERRGGTLRLRGLLEVREDEGADDGHGDEDSPYMRRLRRARRRASSMSARTRASSSERVNESVVLMDYASVTNTMINVKVNKSDPTDLYEQVAAEIRRAIADGEANPGERLPPAKDLAAVLGVNTNTVLRSLRAAPRRGTTRVPARAWHLGRRDARTGRGRAAREGARRVRPPPGLPTRRAGRDHRERWLTHTHGGPFAARPSLRRTRLT